MWSFTNEAIEPYTEFRNIVELQRLRELFLGRFILGIHTRTVCDSVSKLCVNPPNQTFKFSSLQIRRRSRSTASHVHQQSIISLGYYSQKALKSTSEQHHHSFKMQSLFFLIILAAITSVFAIGDLTDVERASLLAGPALSCHDDGCIDHWAANLSAQGLVTEFERVHAGGLPPQLAAYLEIDANMTLAMSVKSDIVMATASGDKLKTVCCAQCNMRKMDKLCKVAPFIPIVMPFCSKEMHRCCMNSFFVHPKAAYRCTCACVGQKECQTVEACKLAGRGIQEKKYWWAAN